MKRNKLSESTMSKIFSWWIVLVFFFESSTAHYECDFLHEIVASGESYLISNPGRPPNFQRGFLCRWIFKSEIRFNMTCNIKWIPSSRDCESDALIIQTETKLPHRYCGSGVVNVASNPGIHQMIVTLEGLENSEPADFSCTVRSYDEDGLYNECGRHNRKRIIGGTQTKINEYPMMAGLVNYENGNVFCGATIINNHQLLTAAHCVSGKHIRSYYVRIGDHDLWKDDETKATKNFQISKTIIHPEYSPITYDNDIAIITTSQVIEFNKFVGAACLPFRKFEEKFEGETVDIMGWGTIEFTGPTSEILQKAELRIMTSLESRQHNSPRIGIRQLGTFKAGSDACQADSGGPILWKNPRTMKLVLIGIISHGSICADGNPGINTRVGAYINWIKETTIRGIEYFQME